MYTRKKCIKINFVRKYPRQTGGKGKEYKNGRKMYLRKPYSKVDLNYRVCLFCPHFRNETNYFRIKKF